MPGFFISNMDCDIELDNYRNENSKRDSIYNEKFKIKRNTLNKFLDDKVFYEDENLILITEGVILNKIELTNKYNKNNFIDTIKEMILNDRETFYSEFRGTFSGAVYYKNDDTWIIYTNHVGDKAIFYYNDNNKFIIGSQVNYIIDSMNYLNIKRNLNEQAVYHMLTYGFMGEGITYADNINRLSPGCYIKIVDSRLEVLEYHRFKCNTELLKNKTEEEIIDLLDEKFRRAIKLEYDKDLEYGYKHISDLSGGLDSRMNVWVSRVMGYDNMLNLTYCQANYLDEIIAKQISSYLKNEMLFKPLDDLSFMFDNNDIIKMNYGMALYSGITGGKRLLEYVNFREFGIEHTGQLGDVVVGTYISNAKNHNRPTGINGAYSNKLIDRVDKKHIEKYDTDEEYRIYTRGFNGILSTHLIRQNYTEVTSPFLDVDFMEFCMSIPLNLRQDHILYLNWIKKKYNKAGDFIWEKTNCKPNDNNFKQFMKKIVIGKCLKGIPRRIMRVLRIKSSSNSMNPFDYWYENDSRLSKYLNQYFDNNINNNIITEQIREDMKLLFNKGTVSEKVQVITVLTSLSLYFGEKNEYYI